MTDSSSEKHREEVADIAAELISTKIDAARRETQQTHMLRIGPFHMEIIPDDKVDIERFFTDTYNYICDRYENNPKFWNAGEGQQDGKHYS